MIIDPGPSALFFTLSNNIIHFTFHICWPPCYCIAGVPGVVAVIDVVALLLLLVFLLLPASLLLLRSLLLLK
jgi:hypothetical protein